ncbi:MAG: hypothetical protein V3U80_06970 [Flavobacteriaceae bacterium]
MMHFILPFLQVNVTEKLKNAPDGNYQIGIIIGTYLPFVAFALIAWYVYWRAKNRKDFDD